MWESEYLKSGSMLFMFQTVLHLAKCERNSKKRKLTDLPLRANHACSYTINSLVEDPLHIFKIIDPAVFKTPEVLCTRFFVNAY